MNHLRIMGIFFSVLMLSTVLFAQPDTVSVQNASKDSSEKHGTDSLALQSSVVKNNVAPGDSLKDAGKKEQSNQSENVVKPSPSRIQESDKSTKSSGTNSVQFALEIPAGVLFGKFEKQNGPFHLKGSIVVPSGQVLEFGPGCVVYVGGDYSTITVFGQIVVKGTREEPVIFQSVKTNPNPWDWDRIYCRSRNRSTFEHCIIRHSNYGVMVENGSVMMNYCQFDHNSIHGLVVRNSDATILNTTFKGGHVLAIQCDAGADVQAESLFVSDNITGIAVNDKGTFALRGGDISRNTTGIVVMKGSSVSIVAADITHNHVGLVSEVSIPKKVSEMNYGNGMDMKIATRNEIDKILKAPESVKSVVLPKSNSQIRLKDDFAPGFSAVRAPKEITTSLIGNVTTGLVYFDPLSFNDSLKQSHYPGEQAPGRADNVQPELQVFANGKKGETDVAVLVDVYGNEWTGFRRNNTNLILNYSDQSVVIGDFYENNSETSISGRKLTGFKFDGNFWEMGRGTKRTAVKLAFGQSEMPKQYGNHELDLYNTPVDTGMSIRQQLTYEAALTYKPTFYSSLGVRGLIARDQGYKTFIGGAAVDDPKAPNLIQAQTGCIDGKMDLLGGKLSLMAELDMGKTDTLIDTLGKDKEQIDKIAWYDPQVPDALSKVFGIIPSGKNFAFTAGATGIIEGYKINLLGSQIAPSFFAAGNPYLETDKRALSLTAEKEYSEKLSASLGGEYQRRTLSTSPVDNSTVRLGGKYAIGQNLPEFNAEYMFYYETNTEHQNVKAIDSIVMRDTVSFDTISHTEEASYAIRDFKNMIGIEARQQFANDMDYSIKYQLLKENDETQYINPLDINKRNGIQHQFSARYGFKIGKALRNRTTVRTTTKDEKLDSLHGLSYKISNDLKLVLIPRKLNLNLKGEYSNKVDKKIIDTTTSEVAAPKVNQSLANGFTAFEAEVKYSMTAKWSMTARGRYENAKDETPGSRENYSVKIISFYCTYLF